MLQRLAIGLVLVSAGCTHRFWRPNSGWVASKTANVTVYTDAKWEHRHPQESLELAFSAYKALLPTGIPEKIEVLYLQAEPGSGKRFFKPNDDVDRSSWSLETVPGDGKIGRGGIIVLEEPLRAGAFRPGAVPSRMQEEAARELAHQFIVRAVPEAPMWLQIGLARYMADHRIFYKDDLWMVCFGEKVFPYRPGESRGDTARDALIPLADLVRMGWYDYDKDGRYWFSFTAFAFVHYLIHGKGGFHRTRFPVFLDALQRGKSAEEALGLAYPHIVAEEWDTELEAYTHPSERERQRARVRTLASGFCMRIPPARQAEMQPRRTPVPEEEIRTVMNGLQQVDLFRSHATWMPADVVAAEAAKRGGKVQGPAGTGQGEGTGSGKEGQGRGGPGWAPAGLPAPDPSVPSIRNTPP